MSKVNKVFLVATIVGCFIFTAEVAITIIGIDNSVKNDEVNLDSPN
jgi:uncharacterized membrane protein